MLLPIGVFLGGVALLVVAVATGEADVSLVLIFPVFSGSSAAFLIGVLLIFLSFILGFVMLARGATDIAQTQQTAERRTEFGGVVLIGPIPIAFGSNKKVALIMLVIGVAAALLMVGLLLAL